MKRHTSRELWAARTVLERRETMKQGGQITEQTMKTVQNAAPDRVAPLNELLGRFQKENERIKQWQQDSPAR
jgi:hypothetical protein